MMVTLITDESGVNIPEKELPLGVPISNLGEDRGTYSREALNREGRLFNFPKL